MHMESELDALSRSICTPLHFDVGYLVPENSAQDSQGWQHPRVGYSQPTAWPLTPKIDRVTWLFLKFDRVAATLATVTWSQNDSDMGHCHFFNSTGDKWSFKRHSHTTLPFLEIDMQHQSPRQGPLKHLQACTRIPLAHIYQAQGTYVGYV